MDVRIELCYDYMPTWLLKRILRTDLMNEKRPMNTPSHEMAQARHKDRACGDRSYVSVVLGKISLNMLLRNIG